ncbi:MAG: hypothetical protein JXR95_13980 [Deltaproteobacteria bacterium]|nr:hypothetical protein [Deltaproteobacteria bacterium]
MKKLFTLILFSLVFIVPSMSEAKILELFVQPQTGYLGGLFSQSKLPWGDTERTLNTEEDYYKTHAGPFAGVSVGLEFMLIDAVLEVNQQLQSERKSTYFAFKLGLDADFELGESSVGTIYLMAGAALATIDDAWAEEAQVSHDDLYSQILFLDAGFRYEYKITEVIRFAFDAGIGAHILQLSQKAANQDDSQSSGVHFYFKGGLRLVFDVFGGKSDDEKPGSEDALPPVKTDVTPQKTVEKSSVLQSSATSSTPSTK